MSCEKPSLSFQVAACEPDIKTPQQVSSVECQQDQLVAIARTEKFNYRAVLVKNDKGLWSQKGKVWSISKSAKKAETAAVVGAKEAQSTVKPDAKTNAQSVAKADANERAPASLLEKIAKKQPQVKVATPSLAPSASGERESLASARASSEEGSDQGAEVTRAPATLIEKVTKKDEETSSDWALKYGGWMGIEAESFQNIGDGVGTIFDSNDSHSKQSDTNLLGNFQFTVTKKSVTFDALLEVGEVFFGDPGVAAGGSDSGGGQGLRGKIIRVRNLTVQEEFAPGWFFRVGLYTPFSDPRGFVLADHHAGAQLRYEKDSIASQLWYAVAADSKPGTVVNRDIYFGGIYTHKYFTDSSFTGFFTNRSTRETFMAQDLSGDVSGASTYNFVGVNNIIKNLWPVNVEANLILSQSQFKSLDGLQKDSNSGYLFHFRTDTEAAGVVFGLDGLTTSGVADSRSGSSQILGKRKNFAASIPSAAYLLTIATSDGADDAVGSLRTTTANNIGRLDIDEGLRVGVLSAEKEFTEQFSSMIRYGALKSAVARQSTNSDDYGSEIDVRLRYRSTPMTSWTLEHGYFKPGNYFVNKDAATLTSLRYKLEF